MSRESQVNSFNDGINMDLNPLLTPNTVMTDCLNGTIITYNGNEFALQNDLGNYKFINSELNPGFTPVGIKEYANILYIISYNPITDEVEVGSFPSMKTIFASDIDSDDKNAEDLKLENKYNYYTKIKSTLTLLSDFDDKFMLNPGDKYILEQYGTDNTVSNQKLYDDAWCNTRIYILTENKKLYDITPYVKIDLKYETNNSIDFSNVKWEVPGWMAVRPSVNVMDEFNCYVGNLTFSYSDNSATSVNAVIKVQSTWDSELYGNIIDNYIMDEKDLSIKNNLFYIYDEGDKIDSNKDWSNKIEEFINKNNISNNIITYNDIQKVIYNNFNISTNSESIVIVPVLRVDDNGEYKYIIYDQFQTVLSLSKSKFDLNYVEVCPNIFKYYVGPDSVTINMDLISNSESNLYYRILDLDKNPILNWTQLHDFDYCGQNIFNINYDQVFCKEDIYVIQIKITPNSDDKELVENYGNSNNLLFEAPIYCSEVSNIYYRTYDHYWSNEFKLNEDNFAIAISRGLKVKNPITNTNASISSEFLRYKYTDKNNNITEGDFTYNEYDNTINLTNGDDIKDKLLSHIVVEDLNKSEFKKNLVFLYGTEYVWKNNIEFDIPSGSGTLWDNINGIINADVEVLTYDNYNNIHKLIVNNDKTELSLSVTSTSTINIDADTEIKEGPTEADTITFDKVANAPITKLDDGWYKFNHVVFIMQNSNGRKASLGPLKPKDDIKFKLYSMNENEIVFKTKIGVNEEEYDLKFEDGLWTWNNGPYPLSDKYSKDNEMFKWDDNKDVFKWGDEVKGGNDYWGCKTNFYNVKCPSIILYYNNADESDAEYYISIDSSGKRLPGFYRSDLVNVNTDAPDARLFLDIGMNQPINVNEDHFELLVNNDSTTWTNPIPNWSYINEIFGIYFTMATNIKYSIKSSPIRKYILKFNNYNDITNNLYIKNIEYNITNVDLGKSGNKYVDLDKLNMLVKNLVFNTESNINSYLQNIYDTDITTAINKYTTDLNMSDIISNARNDLYNTPIIGAQTFFVDQGYKNKTYSLSMLINNLIYDNSLGITWNEVSNNNNKISVKTSNDINKYYITGYISSKYFFRQ